MDDIENSTSNAISFEATISAGTLGTPCQMGLSPRRNLYLLNLQSREKVSERTNEIQSSTPDVPINSKRKDSGNSDYSGGSIGYNDVKRSLNGRRLKNGPSTPIFKFWLLALWISLHIFGREPGSRTSKKPNALESGSDFEAWISRI